MSGPAGALHAPPGTSDGDAAGDRRRLLQLGLALLWFVDGLLQLQPYMFTSAFAHDVVAGGAAGEPGWIASTLTWAAGVVAAAPALAGAAFATVQLAIAVGIAFRPTVRIALAASIVWAAGVWWFGEAAGGLFAGPVTILTGAPGAALLYLVLSVLLWPAPSGRPGCSVAVTVLRPRPARLVWAVFWLGMAALSLEPGNLRPDAGREAVHAAGQGQPLWLQLLDMSFSAQVGHLGGVASVAGVAVLALTAAGIFLPPSSARVAPAAAFVIGALVWVLGQGLGSLFGGTATDLNSGPLVMLLALVYWPVRTRPDGPGPRGGASA